MRIHHTVQTLLDEIAHYRRVTGMTRTQFGEQSINDGYIISRMENGRIPRATTVDKLREFMNRNASRRRHG